MSDILKHVHATHEDIETEELTPPHLPREDTPVYRRAHHFLVVVKDSPCEVCGVRNSTLGDASQNRYAATAVETHHHPVERSLCNACDPVKVHKDFPGVYDQATLEAFIDSPLNLKVLCSTHHRSPTLGIHHLLPQDFFCLRYLYDQYQIASAEQDAVLVEAADQDVLDHIAVPVPPIQPIQPIQSIQPKKELS